MAETLALDPRLDLRAAHRLAAAIQGHEGDDLALDAAEVTHLGAPALQVIRAAARSWAEAGHALTLLHASTDLADQLQLMGFTPGTVTEWEGRP